jgi:hypothetical protein
MLEDTLFSLGFRRTPSEHAIYVRRTCNALLVVRVYVDDLLITNSDCDDIKLFKEEMTTMFKISDLNLLHYYLGTEVKQSTSRTSLSQGAYARKLPERCGLARCIHCQMPMEARATPIKQSTQPLVDATAHLSIIRNLRYLVNTHLDLVFAIGYVSHFLEEPWEDHLVAVKRILHCGEYQQLGVLERILCYVVGTSNWGLWIGQKKGTHVMLTGFSDVDFAGDVDARKSTTGVTFFLANNPVT